MLENYLLNEAFAKIEERLVNQLAAADTDWERVERCRNLLVALRLVRKYIENIVASGTMAAMDDQRRSMFERMMNPR